jgi:MFS family permease
MKDDLTRRLRVNRAGVLYFFSLEGGSIGIWSAFLPGIQTSIGLSDDKLGTAAFFFYLGEMVGTPMVAWCLRHWGSKACTYTGSILFTSFLITVALCDSFFTLCTSFLMFGLGECLLDVSMNALAIFVEKVASYPIIGSFHGSYSVAAAVGGAIGGTLVAAGFLQLHVYSVLFALAFMISSFFAIAMMSREEEIYVESLEEVKVEGVDVEYQASDDSNDAAGNPFIPKQQDRQDGGGSVSMKNVPSNDDGDIPASDTTTMRAVVSDVDGSIHNLKKVDNANGWGNNNDWFRMVSNALMIPRTKDMTALAFLAFLAAYGEAALTTWIIIYTHREFTLTSNGTLTALVFSLFEIFMGMGRYCVDTLRFRLGTKKIVMIGGTLTVLGLSLMVASPSFSVEKDATSLSFITCCLGASFTGLGLSTLIPIAYISAGYAVGHSGTNIAIVATWAGGGCIASSPVVGLLSSTFGSLRVALVVLAVSMLPICPLAFLLPPDKFTDDAGGRRSGDGKEDINDDHSIATTSTAIFDTSDDLSQPLIV